MSLENEEPRSPDHLTETNHEMQKKSKISYTREFLLSFSELDTCKKLPSGFDQSILSEFEDAFKDRQRSSGLSAHSFRRNEYGPSPPTRGDVAGYSRPIHGRWESRSTGRSDKDSDSQSDKDSDSGRHFGNQSRRPWQVPEHDGLLGSGSFPRPAGFTAGISAPKVQPNEPYQLNRTNEPYHPPRPYKAAPHSRRDTESFDDETFGSSELTSEERAEEERKRRASFELMRKEQHKALQEQKLKPEKNKGDFDFATLVDDSKDGRRHRSSEVEERLIPRASSTDSEKSSLLLQTAAPRPLVPPGFATTVLERNLGPKSLSHSHEVEVGNFELEENILHAKSKPVLSGTLDNQVEKQSTEQMILSKQQHGSASTHASVDSMSEKNRNPSPPQGALNKIIGIESQLYNISNTSQALEASRNSEVIGLNTEKVMGTKIVGESNQGPSASILEKLFTNAVALNVVGSSNITEHQDIKDDETQSSDTAHSSKFACWFHEEERKPSDDFSSGRQNDLLSLIVGGEKGGSGISDGKILDHSFLSFSSQSSEPADRVMKSDVVSPTVGNSEDFSKSIKPEAVLTVLTCEDLEQSILSGISENVPTLQPPVQKRSPPGAGGKPEQLKANVDNNASHHLLSLLQKGTSVSDMEPSYNQETTYSEILHGTEGATIGTAGHSSKKCLRTQVRGRGSAMAVAAMSYCRPSPFLGKCPPHFHLGKSQSLKAGQASRISALFWGAKKSAEPQEIEISLSLGDFTLTAAGSQKEGISGVKPKKISVSVISSISEVSSTEWDACALDVTGPEKFNPFLTHAFLSSLEESASAVKETGWTPRHVIAKDESESIVGVVPLYLKSHSYGEFVFDHSWADAYYSFGGRYYPKLQSCVPFTPVTGPRILIRNTSFKDQVFDIIVSALKQLTAKYRLSSLHITFPSETEWNKLSERGFLQRTGMQYHWKNHNYKNFDEFLMDMKQSKRKNIRQERKKIVQQNLTMKRLRGNEIKTRHWDSFYNFYRNTTDNKWGTPYLTREFFHQMGEKMGDQVLLVVAEEGDELVAGALNLIGGDTLFGRLWGCHPRAYYPSLHFEACYYQAIEAAIELNLNTVEAGAQGEHKIQRGYLPVTTYSCHYLMDEGFRKAIENFVGRESTQVELVMKLVHDSGPFKEGIQ